MTFTVKEGVTDIPSHILNRHLYGTSANVLSLFYR